MKTKLSFLSVHKKKIISIIILILAVMICFFLLIINQSNKVNQSFDQLIVTNSYINIRKSPDVNSKKIGKVRINDIYTIISREKDSQYEWFEIITSNTKIHGFIASPINKPYIKIISSKENGLKEENENMDKVVNEGKSEASSSNKTSNNNNNKTTTNNKVNSNKTTSNTSASNKKNNQSKSEKKSGKERLKKVLTDAGFTCDDIKCILKDNRCETVMDFTNKSFKLVCNVSGSNNTTLRGELTYYLVYNSTIMDAFYSEGYTSRATYYGNNGSFSCGCPSCPNETINCDTCHKTIIDFYNYARSYFEDAKIYKASDL